MIQVTLYSKPANNITGGRGEGRLTRIRKKSLTKLHVSLIMKDIGDTQKFVVVVKNILAHAQIGLGQCAAV